MLTICINSVELLLILVLMMRVLIKRKFDSIKTSAHLSNRLNRSTPPSINELNGAECKSVNYTSQFTCKTTIYSS